MLSKHIVDIARQLRRNQTPAESQLWDLLRARKFKGLKFLRQHPIIYGGSEIHTDFFIADFYCHEKRLVIEVDGKYHEFQKKFDLDRDSILMELGLVTLRVKNEEMENPEKVLGRIEEFLTHPVPPSLQSREGVTERSKVGGELNLGESGDAIGIIILAAGSSSRMGQTKQLLPIQGSTLLEKTVQTALQAGCKKIVVVLGSEAERHQKALGALPVSVVRNPDWERGMGTSIKAGIRYFLKDAPSRDAVIIMVCDQPLLTADHLKKLKKKSKETKRPIVASFYANTMGVPALFKKDLFNNLNNLEDDQGAKKIIHQFRDSVERVDFPGGAVDLDTPDDYSTFIQYSKT